MNSRLGAPLALSLLLLPCPLLACGTDTASAYNRFVAAGYGAGRILQTNDFVRGKNSNGVKMSRHMSAQLAYGWQTLGRKEWEIAHKLPAFGVGVGVTWCDNRPECGTPLSLFGFYDGVLARWGNHTVIYGIEAGLAFLWDAYDERHTPHNVAIGSKCTVHLKFSAEYSYLVASRWRASAGAYLTHFSNGAMRKPNKGMNLAGWQVRLAYLLDRRPSVALRPLPKQKGNEVDITVGYGYKRFEVDTVLYAGCKHAFDTRIHYSAVTLQGVFLHRYCHRGKYGAGVSVVYDDHMGSSLRPTPDGHAAVVHGKTSKRFALGVVAAHELCISRLSVVTHLGYYVSRPGGIASEQRKESLFQRAGLKYTFPNNLHAGVNIYAHRLSRADFIEWNVGYSLPVARRAKSGETAK